MQSSCVDVNFVEDVYLKFSVQSSDFSEVFLKVQICKFMFFSILQSPKLQSSETWRTSKNFKVPTYMNAFENT